MELSKKDVRIQAEQFLSYFSKFKDTDLDERFRFWADSKDFDKETERAIRREVDRLIRQKNAR
jgi:hypothetical protein